MKTTHIINPELQKPWLLIAIYNSMFDKYIALQKQLWYIMQGAENKDLPLTIITQGRIERMRDKLTETSQILRETDEKIHQYIRTHQS